MTNDGTNNNQVTSRTHTEEAKQAISEYRKGKIHTAETCAKMSESQKGKHSGKRSPRKKKDTQSNNQLTPPTADKVRSETAPKYGIEPTPILLETSKFPNETQTNSPPVPDTTPPLPIHCYSHSNDDTVFYVGFGNDPDDTTNMSDTWHSFADKLEWKSVILDRDCTPKEVRELAKYYLDLHSPAVNLQEIKLADEEELLLGMSARDRRLSEQSEYGDNEFIPYGQEDDDVPKEEYINGYGHRVIPPGAEKDEPTMRKTGVWKDENGEYQETWVDTSPQKKETIKPVVDKELEQRKQLEAMREICKRALEAPDEIDENEDYSERETISEL